MSFLHPWAIALGVAAVGLPLLIHWLTRPRPVVFPLSTVRFVQEAVQARRARHRLRDFIILLLRGLAVLLLAGAFARLLMGSRPLISSGETARAARVVVLDVSQSMAAAVEGVQLFERARPTAAEHLAYRPSLQVNLILAGARPRPVFDRVSSNFAALRDELSKAQPLPERLNLSAAINLAAEMLAAVGGEGGPRRELVVVSDFQRSNWADADFSPLPADTVIQLESVAPKDPPPNLALLRAGTRGRAEQGGQARVEVEVGNFSGTPRRLEVELSVGQAAHRMEGLCPAGARTTLSAAVPVHQAGWQSGVARLLGVEDALAADDARPLVLEARPAPTYALITRESDRAQPTASYYLERALVPSPAAVDGQGPRVVRIDPAHLDPEGIAPADLIALVRPGLLSPETVNLLTAMLRRGRAVLYAAAEPADASNLKMLAAAAGSDLQMPVEFVAPAAGQGRRDLFLLEVRRDEAPFSIFGDKLAEVIGPLRFSGGLASRQLEGGLRDEVLGLYNDRSACLVATACGMGALGVINADLAASNLARSPAFVPLVGELVERLLGPRRAEEAAACGEPLAIYLPPEAGTAEGLTVSGPASAGPDLGELVEESTGVLWRWGGGEAPGVYEIKRGDRTVLAMAFAAPALESDLSGLGPFGRSLTVAVRTMLEERLAGGRTVQYRSAGSEAAQGDDWWPWFAVGCLACMLVELLALRLFKT